MPELSNRKTESTANLAALFATTSSPTDPTKVQTEWHASPLIDISASTSIFKSTTALNSTQEFAIKLQSNSNYDRATLFKHAPKAAAPPVSTLPPAWQQLFPAKKAPSQTQSQKKKQTAKTTQKKSKHNITKAQWKEISDANKVLLAKQQAHAKNEKFRQEYDSPHCIICNLQHSEDPAHIFSACPTTQAMAATACDTHITRKLNEAYSRLRRTAEKQQSPAPVTTPFWTDHTSLSQQHPKLPLWLAQGAVPASFNNFNLAHGFTPASCSLLANLLSQLMIERSQFIYAMRSRLHGLALHNRPPDPPVHPP